MKRDPVRLLDDPFCSPALRADLEAESRTMHALAFDAAASAARLHAAIDGGAKLGAVGRLATTKGGLTSTGWLGAKAAWILVGSVAIAGVVGFGLSRRLDARLATAKVRSPAGLAHAVPIPVPHEDTATPPGAMPPATAAQVEPPPEAQPEPVAAPLAPPEVRASNRTPVRASGPKTDDVAEETAALTHLREIAKSDPPGALALADQGQKRFPSGIFVQEREAIAITALDQLGRKGEAMQRARAFLAHYSDSPLAGKVRRIAGASD
jgi:hypothetical protein